MSRRPDLIKAILLAGLIYLAVCLPGQAYSRGATDAPARPEKASEVRATNPSKSRQLAARQPATSNQTRPKESATRTSSFCQPLKIRWFTGGFLGSLLCYYVYGYPLSYVWQEGLWPPGLLDILVIAAFCYLGYRCYRRWREGKKPPKADLPPRFLRPGNEDPPQLTVLEEAKPGLAAIQETGQDFDLQVFGEEVLLLLLDLYYAWNREEVNSLNGRVKESLLEYLQMGLKIMSLREERSYLEEMILEGITVTAAGVNDGKEHITVCFRGRLLDYVLDRKSGKLLLGSMAYPAIFQEYWDMERPWGESAWVLQDIREA